MGATDGHGDDGVHQRRPQHLVQSRHSQRHELPRLRRLLIRRRRPPPPPFPILLPQVSLSLLCFFQTQFIPIKLACLIILVS